MIERRTVALSRFARESFWMRTIDDIAVNGAGVLKSLLMEAYRAGYEAGSREGAANFKSKVAQLLSADTQSAPELPASETEQALRSVEVGDRAIPGTVKPAVLQLIRRNPQGIPRSAIEKQTGFKPNSVRGTLWTLMNERSIMRDDHYLYHPCGEEEEEEEELEAAGREPSREPPADQGDHEVSEQPPKARDAVSGEVGGT